MNIYRKFIELIGKALEYLEGVALILIVAVAVLGIIVGFKYYRHTQEDPRFCMSCHVMRDAFTEWYNGKHRDIVCQKCHQLSILEQNQLLVAYL
jgi:nitrate/TMAO reductase-like tetraheme cytochrome c subunit